MKKNWKLDDAVIVFRGKRKLDDAVVVRTTKTLLVVEREDGHQMRFRKEDGLATGGDKWETLHIKKSLEG